MDEADRKRLRNHITRATRIVNSWPEWKQNILENSSKPTVSVPREPVTIDTMRERAESVEAARDRLLAACESGDPELMRAAVKAAREG